MFPPEPQGKYGDFKILSGKHFKTAKSRVIFFCHDIKLKCRLPKAGTGAGGLVPGVAVLSVGEVVITHAVVHGPVRNPDHTHNRLTQILII
jgi:hypothetical protein